ncbi:hypothetical protein [Enterobacter sp.]|uniref:hypothetical protein n=1 Tax=Enterobacter sp. TaxID=42895 RepID=UPI00296EB603|nr:hypothetical protein [Enterobacter sp.]
MSKYEKLDQIILNKIGGHPAPFMGIYVRDVFDECEKLSTRKYEGFRVLDRRLQALKKRGLIRCIRGKGWVRA